MKFKKILLILSVATFISGCVKKETSDLSKNEEVNKAYTEDENGEMVFYDLKKPAIEATVEVVESDHEDLSKLLFNDIKDKVSLIDKINIKDQPNLSQITIKLNKISVFGDSYLGQMAHEFPIILKGISNRLKNKNISAYFVQGFDDGTSLNMNFKGSDLSTVSQEDLFIKMRISNNDVEGDAKIFLNLLCDSYIIGNTDSKFCKNDVADENQAQLKKSKPTSTITSRDGVDKIIEENTEFTTLKKEHGLSDDQKKTLQDAGFEITLNE